MARRVRHSFFPSIAVATPVHSLPQYATIACHTIRLTDELEITRHARRISHFFRLFFFPGMVDVLIGAFAVPKGFPHASVRGKPNSSFSLAPDLSLEQVFASAMKESGGGSSSSAAQQPADPFKTVV